MKTWTFENMRLYVISDMFSQIILELFTTMISIIAYLVTLTVIRSNIQFQFTRKGK